MDTKKILQMKQLKKKQGLKGVTNEFKPCGPYTHIKHPDGIICLLNLFSWTFNLPI